MVSFLYNLPEFLVGSLSWFVVMHQWRATVQWSITKRMTVLLILCSYFQEIHYTPGKESIFLALERLIQTSSMMLIEHFYRCCKKQTKFLFGSNESASYSLMSQYFLIQFSTLRNLKSSSRLFSQKLESKKSRTMR